MGVRKLKTGKEWVECDEWRPVERKSIKGISCEGVIERNIF